MEEKLNTTTNICSVPGCGGRIKPLFSFPNPKSHLNRFRQWVHAVHNPRYKGLSDIQIHRRGFVCSKHFKPEDFQSLNKLLCFAVPTLNLHPDVEGKVWKPEPPSSEPESLSATELETDYVEPTLEGSSNRQVINECELFQNSLYFRDDQIVNSTTHDSSVLLRGSIFRDSNIIDARLEESDQNNVLIIGEDNNTHCENDIEDQDDVLPIPDEDVRPQNSLDLCHNSVSSVLEQDASSENCFELNQTSLSPLRDEDENCNNTNQFESEIRPCSDWKNLENQPGLSSHNNIFNRVFPEQLPSQEAPIHMEKPYFKSVKSFLQDCRRMMEVCRVCFQSLEDDEVIKLYEEFSDQGSTQLKHMLKLVLPDLDLEIYPNTVICVKCAELLVYSYQLKEKWLSTEEKLQKIIEKKKGVINRDADLVIIGKRVITKAEAEMDHDYIGKPQYEKPPEAKPPDALLPQLLQSFDVGTNGKCLSEHVSIFHGNLDENNFVPTTQYKYKYRQSVAKPPEVRPSMCDQCGLMYPNKRSLNRHLKTHNKPSKIKVKLSTEPTNMCEICGKLFAHVGSLKMHRISHLEKKCSFCDRVFKNHQQLRFHIASKHRRASYQCHLCGKQYPYRNSLAIHLKRHNPANRNKACHICNKKFFTTAHLKKHIYSHVTANLFKCDFCGKCMKHRWSLQKHINTWHLNQAKHVCEFCNKPYWKRCDLEKHRLRLHKDLVEGLNEDNCAPNSILQQALTMNLKINEDNCAVNSILQQALTMNL